MADFIPAFEAMLKNEGGYVLHNVAGDRGGMTYAGIARNMNPQWVGWQFIDAKQEVPAQMVRDFYKPAFWDNIGGDQIVHQDIAQHIFDFQVNTGKPARVLAQLVVGVTPDGSFGQRTIDALNAQDPEKFVLSYSLAKIARYRDIVQRDKTQLKFITGWLNRVLGGLK
jgi:lysozyme family protein